jgi:hypothetical protein
MPRPRASQTPSFALEFASSFVVCAALATLDVQATLARKYLGPILERVGARALADDDAAVTLALLFVNLAIVFSPSYQALTRGATNNPTAYALKGMLGDTGAARACANACAAVLAHVCALKAVMVVMQTHPEYLPGKGAIAPIVPTGTTASAAAAETAVVAANFLFFGLAERAIAAALIPTLVSGFYVMTMMIEGCRYSCGYMNPSTVIASHALAGDLKSREAFEACAPYVIGGIAGSVVVAIAAKVLVPEPKSAKRARAQSKAVVRSISKARAGGAATRKGAKQK